MPLHLHYAASPAPLLDEILAPLIRRHIDFKLRDSFRIITPDAESRQDLEQIFLNHDSLGGVLIGKSLLTLASFAQTLLLEHPAPQPVATQALQRKALKRALKGLRPDWDLNPISLQRCLRELQGLRRIADLRLPGRGGLGFRLDAEFQKILDQDFGAWTLERSLREAWDQLGRRGGRDLAKVEECWFLGFRLPEPLLLQVLEALTKVHPAMAVHLLLPLREQLVDSEGRLEPWLKRVEGLAASQELAGSPLLPRLEIQPYPTPVHESASLRRGMREHGAAARILVPGLSPVTSLLEAEFQTDAAPRGLAGTEAATVTQLTAELFAALEGEDKGTDPVPFSEIVSDCVPRFQDFQSRLAQNSDFESLRFLDAGRKWLMDCAAAEVLDPESRPRGAWLKELKEDLVELRLPNPAGHAGRLPLRRLDRAGLAVLPQIFLAGMNEGAYPAPPTPAFFEEESARFLILHEEALAFRQALYLAKQTAVLSYSQFSLSGRSLVSSPYLAELETAEWREPAGELPLAWNSRHPYFQENAAREARRHRGAEPDRDAGNLSALPLRPLILEKLLSHPLSATYLDDYAKCPWRFFARRHLQLKEEPEEDLEIDPRRRGSLIHRLLEKVFSSLIEDFFEAGRVPSSTEVDTGLTTAFAQIQEETLGQPSRVPRVLVLDQLERLRRAVESLLSEERSTWLEAPERLVPKHLEWRFGRGGSPALHLELEAGLALPLTGAVDRIDVSTDGRHFLLIDYKSSGSSDLAGEIRAGQSLQLWIYLQAVRRLLYPSAEALGGLYWDLKGLSKNQGMARREAYRPFSRDKLHAGSKSFLKEEAFKELEEKLESELRRMLGAILRGDYSLQPPKCLGSYCEFREICRYDQKPRN